MWIRNRVTPLSEHRVGEETGILGEIFIGIWYRQVPETQRRK